MKVVKSNKRNTWKILISSYVFGIIPWKKYQQHCDGCSGGQGCSDIEYNNELKALEVMAELELQHYQKLHEKIHEIIHKNEKFN